MMRLDDFPLLLPDPKEGTPAFGIRERYGYQLVLSSSGGKKSLQERATVEKFNIWLLMKFRVPLNST